MARPYIKTVTGTVSVLADGAVPLGQNLVTGYCRQRLYMLGNGVNISDRCINGYKISVHATFTAPAAGVVTLAVQQNGTTIPGATASETVTTAATETRTISFSTIVKSVCGNASDLISLVNAGVAADFTNVELDVERI